jgi:leader peptidase (prepilin peptidase) / N-methyltransferase
VRGLQKIPASPTGADVLANATIICVAIAAVAASIAVAPNASGVVAAGLALTATAIAVVDARSLIIPNELSGAGVALGLLYSALVGYSAVEAIAIATLRGLTLALFFLAMRAAYRRLRGRDGLGLGDVKLAAVAGVWLDWQMMAVAVNIAAIAALAVYVTRQVTLGRSIRSTGRLPFGLFFAPAIWVTWLIDISLLAP